MYNGKKTVINARFCGKLKFAARGVNVENIFSHFLYVSLSGVRLHSAGIHHTSSGHAVSQNSDITEC